MNTEQERAAVEADRKRRGEPDYFISACYFQKAGEVELSWERKEDGAKATLTCKVTPEQGSTIANVVWPCVYHTASPQPAAPAQEPSDSEIMSLAYDVGAMPEQMTDESLLRFARTLLARYGQPAQPHDLQRGR